MNYSEELQARLDAVRPAPKEEHNRVNVSTLETKLLEELEEAFELAQYDLDESDILRAIKILEILHTYPEAFKHPKSLKIFFILARMDSVQAKNLLKLSGVKTEDFKSIVNAMAKAKLIFSNEDKNLELSMEGKSLAERIGVDIFI